MANRISENLTKQTTLEPSSPFRAGKIIIYVNSNLQKLHILPPLHNRTHKTTLGGMGASVSWAYAK